MRRYDTGTYFKDVFIVSVKIVSGLTLILNKVGINVLMQRMKSRSLEFRRRKKLRLDH